MPRPAADQQHGKLEEVGGCVEGWGGGRISQKVVERVGGGGGTKPTPNDTGREGKKQ